MSSKSVLLKKSPHSSVTHDGAASLTAPIYITQPARFTFVHHSYSYCLTSPARLNFIGHLQGRNSNTAIFLKN
jgi:hypothetical protein